MEAEDITEVEPSRAAEQATGQGCGQRPGRRAGLEAAQGAGSESAQGAEQRAHPRFQVDEDASLLLVSHDSWHPCRVLDLSLEGCRLSTGDVFRAGIRKQVEVSFRINGIAFRLSGTTQWTDGQHAVGIRFTYPTRRRREELADVLCEVETADAARAAKEAAEELALRQAAVEIPVEDDARAQELAAPDPIEDSRPIQNPRPMDDSPIPRPFAIPAPASVPALEKPLARIAHLPALLDGVERREQVRREVDTTARIFLIRQGYPANGRILNLSVGGCGIRTHEAFPLGIYTAVEAEFHLNGMPFRLGGVIQFIYERNLVGIRFVDLSDRKREQVQLLMAELEREYAGEEAAVEADAGDRG